MGRMDKVERVISASLKEGHPDALTARQEIRKALIDKDLSIEQLVEGFNRGLSVVEVHKRGDLCELLVEMVGLVMFRLNPEDVLILSRFFASRLRDWSCLLGGLEGCLLMISKIGEGVEDSNNALFSMVDVLFESIDVQSLKQSQRSVALRILHQLIDRFGAKIRKERPDSNLLEIAIASVDGEKDPRCLLQVFKIVQSVVKLYQDSAPLMASAEDLFDVVSCYFPITETDDFEVEGHVIVARTDLVQALNQTLASTPAFAEYCLPLLLEKLESDHRDAKLSALTCLQCSVDVFSLDAFCEYFKPLWLEIRRLLLLEEHKQDMELTQVALTTANRLCKLVPTKELDCELFTDLIFSDEYMLDLVPRLRNAAEPFISDSAVNLLKSVSWVNEHTAMKALDCILRKILQDFMEACQESRSASTTASVGEESCRLAAVDGYLAILHELMHALAVAVEHDHLALSDRGVCRKALTDFLIQTYKAVFESTDRILKSKELSSDIRQKAWLLKLDLLHLYAHFSITCEVDWRVQFESLLREIIGHDMVLSETNRKVAIGVLSYMVTPTGKTYQGSFVSQAAWSICVPLLLPAEGLSISPVDDLPLSVESALETNIRFEILRILASASVDGKQQVLSHATSSLSKWICSYDPSDHSKQFGLAALLRFMRRELTRPPSVSDMQQSASQILDAFEGFVATMNINTGPNLVRDMKTLETVSEFIGGLRSFLFMEILSLIRCVTFLVDQDRQRDAFERISSAAQSPATVSLRNSMFSGIEDVQGILSSSDALLQFFASCVESVQSAHGLNDIDMRMQVYRASASAALHLLSSSETSDELVNKCIGLLSVALSKHEGHAEADVTGEVILAMCSLKGILCSSVSYSACKNATERLMSQLCAILQRYWEDKEGVAELSKDHSLGTVAGCGIQFLVSSGHESKDNIFTDPEDKPSWSSPIQHQRAFSICMNGIHQMLETRDDRTGALLAVGYLGRGAREEFIKMESNRILPWLLNLIERLQSEYGTNCEGHRLLVSSMLSLRTLLTASCPHDTAQALKHEIMRTVLNSVRFEHCSDVRATAVSCMVMCVQSILTRDDHPLYRLRVTEALTTAVDDPKRKVRQLAVKSGSHLEKIWTN